jgi:hypothetical protein
MAMLASVDGSGPLTSLPVANAAPPAFDRAGWQNELARYSPPTAETPAPPSPTTATQISVQPPMVLTDKGALIYAYTEFGKQQGLSPEAARAYGEDAYALTGGKAYGPSTDPDEDGAELTPKQLQDQLSTGRIEVSPTRAQIGLLYAYQMQGGDDPSITGQFGAGGTGTQFFPKAANVLADGSTAVETDIAFKMLENMGDGRPPFRPELGNIGGTSWFVTDGNPYVGRPKENPTTIPVEISNPSGKPIVEFNEKQLLEIFEQEKRLAEPIVEQQYRTKNNIPAEQPLSKKGQSNVNHNTFNMAQRKMWERVGQQVAASESGLGRVTLQNSQFSKPLKGIPRNGEFMLTSRPDTVKIQGGATTLIDILKAKGEPADPATVKAAEDTAAKEKWTGHVQGVFKWGGRVLIVVGAAADGYRIYTADNKAKETAEVVGGWAGATAAGAGFASWASPALATGPWGWVAYGAGTIIAGGVGYVIGEKAGEEVYELVVDGDPILIGPDD